MSTDHIDPDMVERTRQEIRTLVQEIGQLAKRDLAPMEFYPEFLRRVVSALAALGGAVWIMRPDGGIDLEYQIGLEVTGLGQAEYQLPHARLLRKLAAGGEGALVPPRSGSGDGTGEGNPTDLLLILAPLRGDQEVCGVVEVFQRPVGGPTTQKGYLRFLLEMSALASDYLKNRQLRHFTDRQVLWDRLESFTRAVHGSLDPQETAFTITNEGRRLIGCDRVSVAIRKGRKYVVQAVSGQETFDNRSTTIARLNRLATAVVATGESVWYTGDADDLAPQVEAAVQEYVDESHSKTVAVLPLARPAQPGEPRPEPIGALVVEQIEDSRLGEGLVERVDVVRDHSATALANALEHQQLFLMPLWRTLGKATWLIKARTLPKTLAVAGVLLAAVIALRVIPADFELEGRGTLQPIKRREVFAGIDGDVTTVHVRHGDLVEQGAPLMELRNVDLDVSLTSLRGERRATLERFNAVKSALLGQNRLTEFERTKLHGERLQLEQTLVSIDRQLELHEQKQQALKIVSPIKGQVVTWDVFDLLIHRPVKRGDVLLRVVEPEADWELEVLMPEDRMGHITRAQKALGDELEVEYILATDPGLKHYGKVKEVQYSAEVRGEEGNTVLVKVEIDKKELPQLLPGAQVTAKVDCGRRSIGYVWLHDLFAFVQSRILFRLW